MKGRWESNTNVWFRFMYIPRNETARPHYFQNIIIMFCLPISTFIYLWAIYLFPGPVCLLACSKIGRWSCDPVSLRSWASGWGWGNIIPPFSLPTTWSCSKTLHDLIDQQSPSLLIFSSFSARHATTLCYGGQPNDNVISRIRNEDFRILDIFLKNWRHGLVVVLLIQCSILNSHAFLKIG